MSASQASCPEQLHSVPKCVLVVEDEILIRLIISEALRDDGFQVIEACNANEALVMVQASPPDLIVTDVNMPGAIDGLGLLAAVRTSWPSLPVIVISGHLEGRAAMEEGARRFIPKPFAFDEVTTAVREEFRAIR